MCPVPKRMPRDAWCLCKCKCWQLATSSQQPAADYGLQVHLPLVVCSRFVYEEQALRLHGGPAGCHGALHM
jgi:hypothetical protein